MVGDFSTHQTVAAWMAVAKRQFAVWAPVPTAAEQAQQRKNEADAAAARDRADEALRVRRANQYGEGLMFQ